MRHPKKITALFHHQIIIRETILVLGPRCFWLAPTLGLTLLYYLPIIVGQSKHDFFVFVFVFIHPVYLTGLTTHGVVTFS